MRRVVAFDVEGRIGLGIAQPLRILQAGVEGQALGLHAGQDVVAGAVQDAEHAVDAVAGHRLAHRLDDRNAAGDRRLIVQEHALLLGDLGERHAVLGKQRLVGGDDVPPGLQRRLDRSPRRPLVAADQLDENIDVGLLGELHRIVEPLGRGQIDTAILAGTARRNGGDDDGPAALAGQFGGLSRQHARHARADGAQPRYSHTQCFSHLPKSPSNQMLARKT